MKIFRNLFRKIFSDKSATDFSGGYVPNRFYSERIVKGPVLIIGDHTGRDYKTISSRIPDTYMLDVVDNGFAPKEFTIVQSVEDPIANKQFKAVLMAEVLEHIWQDRKALMEIRKSMADDGVLLMSVPFWADAHDLHYHIYSPRTIRLVLEHSGFKIIEKKYRGLMNQIPYWLEAIAALIIYPFYGKKSLEKVNYAIYKMFIRIGDYERINCLSFFSNPGILIMAKKDKAVDSIETQRNKYQGRFV